jgi:protocatechuate 3,4-dioxygenase beta subunit
MERRLTRGQALVALGSVSLGALLAGCGGDGESAVVETEGGGTTTVSPATTASAADPGSAAALLDDTSSCMLALEQTEGPYYFDPNAIRSDIREDREGETLRLAIRVRDAASCAPLQNAVVEIWHCDAGGVYSGFDAGEGERFLRGAQVTNADGLVEFVTIYPGWYPGRTVHIHAKVHASNTAVLTTQLYFDEAASDAVYANAPYLPGRDASNDSDGIFDPSLLLRQAAAGGEQLAAISLDVSA